MLFNAARVDVAEATRPITRRGIVLQFLGVQEEARRKREREARRRGNRHCCQGGLHQIYASDGFKSCPYCGR